MGVPCLFAESFECAQKGTAVEGFGFIHRVVQVKHRDNGSTDGHFGSRVGGGSS